ncbi:MAG: hypothetical protein GY895_10050 [Phycisphaera sp.]|nr:hypothetical protein [Phycisphaera sp.]
MTRIADATARRILAEADATTRRLVLAFRICFGRSPSSSEFIACRDFLRQYPTARESDDRQKTASARTSDRNGSARRNRNRNRRGTPARTVDELSAYSAMCQTLFQSAEFRTID